MSAAEVQKANVHTSSFVNSSGVRIFCRYWEPSDTPRALLFILHGAVEHSNIYDPLAKLLASRNYYVFAHDHMGHGESGGRRLGVNDFEIYISDVFRHVEMMKEKFTDLPVFLVAHSMGGAISILAYLRRPDYFKGAVLIGPAIAADPKLTSSFQNRLLKVAGRFLPRLPVASPDYKLACRSEEKVKLIKEDPLICRRFLRAGYILAIHNIMKEVHSKLPLTDFPFLLLQGECDKLCHITGAEEMHELSPSKDKSIKIYSEAYHSLLHEPGGIAEETAEDIVNWLEERS